jgi:uncharacterized protein involved in exopolysaccharide biosynthesis
MPITPKDLSHNHDPDAFDVRASIQSIAHAVRLNKFLVIGTCVLTLFLVTAYIVVWPPVYEATAMMMVERDADPVRDTFYVGWNVFRKDDARTEIELMTSAPILLAVIDKEKLTYDDVYHPFSSHLTYLWQTSWVGRHYRALKAKVLGSEPDTIDPKTLERVRTAVDMHAGITVEPIAESNAGRVTVKGPSRKVAQITNTLLDTYLANRVDRHYDEAKRSFNVLTSQMLEARKALEVIEGQRLQFLQSNGLTFDFQKESLEVGKLSDLEQNIATSKMRIASMEASLKEVENALKQEPSSRTTATMYETNAIREATKMKRRDLEMQLIQTLDRYREDSAEVRELRNELGQLDALIAGSSEKVEKGTTEGLNAVAQDLVQKRNGLAAELVGAKAGLAVMQDTADRLLARLLRIPSMQAQLRDLDRDFGLAQEKYQQVLSKQTQASVSLITTKVAMPSMRIVEYAMPPQDKTQPKPKILYPAALACGLILGTFMAVLNSQASGKLRRDQIENGRGNIPYYGAIVLTPKMRPPAAVASATERSKGNGAV